jgi:hypothetical protein
MTHSKHSVAHVKQASGDTDLGPWTTLGVVQLQQEQEDDIFEGGKGRR